MSIHVIGAEDAFRLVGRISALAGEEPNTEAALASALAEICEVSGWPVGHLFLTRRGDAVGTSIWHGAALDSAAGFRVASERLRMGPGEGLIGRVIQSGRPAWVTDVRRDATFLRRREATEAGIAAALVLPLRAAGEAIGALELYRHEPADPPAELVAVLAVACAEIARMVERRRADEQLEASEQLYRLLFESASDAIFVGSAAGTLTAVNPAACQLLGYSEHELVGRDARSITAPEWLDVVERQVNRKLEGVETEATYEMAVLHRSGDRIPVEVRSFLLADGDEVGLCAIVRDIRARRRAEGALRESEERFRGAFDAAPIGFALFATDGRWLKVNPALCETVGYSEDELLVMRVEDLVHPDNLAEESALRGRVAAGERSSYQVETRYVRKDGSPVRVRVNATLVRGAEGLPAYIVAQIVERDSLPARRDEPASPLSPRERTVLALIAEGLTSAQAAAELGIGEQTVQTHLRRAAAKLSARTRTHAVATAVRLGWLDDHGRTRSTR